MTIKLVAAGVLSLLLLAGCGGETICSKPDNLEAGRCLPKRQFIYCCDIQRGGKSKAVTGKSCRYQFIDGKEFLCVSNGAYEPDCSGAESQALLYCSGS